MLLMKPRSIEYETMNIGKYTQRSDAASDALDTTAKAGLGSIPPRCRLADCDRQMACGFARNVTNEG